MATPAIDDAIEVPFEATFIAAAAMISGTPTIAPTPVAETAVPAATAPPAAAPPPATAPPAAAVPAATVPVATGAAVLAVVPAALLAADPETAPAPGEDTGRPDPPGEGDDGDGKLEDGGDDGDGALEPGELELEL
ncbi:lipase chaperone [Rathayibacter rathayi]|uniref:Lipase chaperone n=1 Tax=Rathayibacter rathayi TaxID=33887 RepID=A0ABX5A7P7_RATRA|nr:lipase chaperone [Rathayibacter rathayi]PPF42641.1 lipase chaperone [Rathayibacter rathayi]PPF75288.1 lipase chaperone [Rathayibacter rathayi]PPG09853.1 lipase chaperone [Rathayibacter rathayi]PPG36433.1 lipase chaperone [Rathayibacter rathayi]